MVDFVVHFLLHSLLLCPAIASLFLIRQIFGRIFSGRMRYRLWLLLLILLAVPFLSPFLPGLSKFLFWPDLPGRLFALSTTGEASNALTFAAGTSDWMRDFGLSVNRRVPPALSLSLCLLWLLGTGIALVRRLHAFRLLRMLHRSSLPLENETLQTLFQNCREELGIRREIPLYTTSFLKSPVFTGILRPRIYLPLHLALDGPSSISMRYLFLHELQHYRGRDAALGFLASLFGALYWFHPAVRIALKEMQNDRELACDAAVLEILKESEYPSYGQTLLHFAERSAQTPFPFTAGVGSGSRQMRKRLLQILSYQRPCGLRRFRSLAAFLLTALFLLPYIPALAAPGSSTNRYLWNGDGSPVSTVDLSSYFADYDGSFVLYDSGTGFWSVYQMESALTRVSPDSTYKPYVALFALEEGILSPDSSRMAWDGTLYPFEEWNRDQDLSSAIHSSVNWYFQALDRELGAPSLRSHLREIGYGNGNLSGDLSSYWLESSLKISPVEQVELLRRLNEDGLGFSSQSARAVKEALFLEETSQGALYGKTGTGQIDGEAVNGWFIGFLERSTGTCYFAINLQAASQATGSRAAQIALDILADLLL